MRQLGRSLYFNLALTLAGTIACVVLFSLIGLVVNRIANPTATHFLRPNGIIDSDAVSRYYWVRHLFLGLGAIGGFVTAQIVWILDHVGRPKHN